jgi:WD40 repeat protein
VTPVRAVAVAGDKSLVAAGRGNTAVLLDPKTGGVVRRLVDPAVTTADGKVAGAAHRSLVEAMAFSPDGKTLATGSFQELALWDVATGKVRLRIDGFADRVVGLAFSADGSKLAAAGGVPSEDGEVKVFDPATGTVLLDLPAAHTDTVFGVAFSPDGKLLATASADKFAKVFEAATGRPVRSFEGHTQHVLDVAWAEDGKRLVTAGADTVLKVWDVEKGEKLRDVPGHKLQITRLAAVGKGPTILTAGGDGTVRLYNAVTGGQMRTYPGAADFVYAVAASPDGAVVAAGGEDGFLRLYDGASGKQLAAVRPGVDEPKPAKGKK